MGYFLWPGGWREMITEVAILNIVKSKSKHFEHAFKKAVAIIKSTKGYIKHELLKCMEEDNKYLLILRWEKLEDHTIGFRKSAQYQEWKKLLHHFYEPFPIVEHYV